MFVWITTKTLNKMHINPLSIYFVILILSFHVGLYKSHFENSLLLLISFDGFRYDYLDLVKRAKRETPNFNSLIANGVKAKWLQDTFITDTFPNHYTIVTGLYEESHGVVGNSMYDPVLNETFRLDNQTQAADSKWWNNNQKKTGPEPIWVTNQKGDDSAFKRRSGVMFWPGAAAENHGIRPFHTIPYDETLPNKTRIDNVIRWFTDTSDPINLGLLYFSEPDGLGHIVGPDAPQMIDMIVELDAIVGYLIEELKKAHLFHKMNIIITSDHGLSQVHHNIELDKYVEPSKYTAVGSSPVWNIRPNEGINCINIDSRIHVDTWHYIFILYTSAKKSKNRKRFSAIVC